MHAVSRIASTLAAYATVLGLLVPGTATVTQTNHGAPVMTSLRAQTGPAPVDEPATVATDARVRRERLPRGSLVAADPGERHVAAIADRTPVDWRAAGVRFRVGCRASDDCRWGTYDFRTRTIWVGLDAFASPQRLEYVVLHELVHVWQFTLTRRAVRELDLVPFGYRGLDGLERVADCLAAAWGASASHYWDCPPDVEAHVRDVFARTTAGAPTTHPG